MTDIDDSNTPPGFWFGEIGARLRDRMRDELHELGLRRGGWRVLHTLAEGPATPGELAERLPRGRRERGPGEVRAGRRGHGPWRGGAGDRGRGGPGAWRPGPWEAGMPGSGPWAGTPDRPDTNPGTNPGGGQDGASQVHAAHDHPDPRTTEAAGHGHPRAPWSHGPAHPGQHPCAHQGGAPCDAPWPHDHHGPEHSVPDHHGGGEPAAPGHDGWDRGRWAPTHGGHGWWGHGHDPHPAEGAFERGFVRGFERGLGFPRPPFSRLPFGRRGGLVERVLAELVERGWVWFDGDRATLTDEGRAAHDAAFERVRSVREAATAGIPAEDYATTLATLEAMARNLGWAPADTAATGGGAPTAAEADGTAGTGRDSTPGTETDGDRP